MTIAKKVAAMNLKQSCSGHDAIPFKFGVTPKNNIICDLQGLGTVMFIVPKLFNFMKEIKDIFITNKIKTKIWV